MFHHLMFVLVAMDLGGEPDPGTHQGASGNKLSCHRFAYEDNSRKRTQKRPEA